MVLKPYENSLTPSAGSPCDIIKIYYALSFDITPPIYSLMISLKDGTVRPISEFNTNFFRYREDKALFTQALTWRTEIPVPLELPPKPPTHEKECFIM